MYDGYSSVQFDLGFLNFNKSLFEWQIRYIFVDSPRFQDRDFVLRLPIPAPDHMPPSPSPRACLISRLLRIRKREPEKNEQDQKKKHIVLKIGERPNGLR